LFRLQVVLILATGATKRDDRDVNEREKTSFLSGQFFEKRRGRRARRENITQRLAMARAFVTILQRKFEERYSRDDRDDRDVDKREIDYPCESNSLRNVAIVAPVARITYDVLL
jgi:hypothetical protein